MIVAEPPGYALHIWQNEQLISHFDTAENHEILARYTTNLQPLVRMLAEEKKTRVAEIAAVGAIGLLLKARLVAARGSPLLPALGRPRRLPDRHPVLHRAGVADPVGEARGC